MNTSIIQDWAAKLGLRHQGVLMSAIRGCDTSPKNSASKTLVRFYRGAVLRPHCGDLSKAQSFMCAPQDDYEFQATAKAALDELDAAPMHYVLHIIHGSSASTTTTRSSVANGPGFTCAQFTSSTSIQNPRKR
jgi:hypothetical protein